MNGLTVAVPKVSATRTREQEDETTEGVETKSDEFQRRASPIENNVEWEFGWMPNVHPEHRSFPDGWECVADASVPQGSAMIEIDLAVRVQFPGNEMGTWSGSHHDTLRLTDL